MTASFDELVQHARCFGTEGVLESAPPALRARLQIELDAIEASQPRRRFKTRKRRRRTPEETVEAVAALRHEGLVPAAIANKLGLSPQYVRRCLKRASQTASLRGKNGSEIETQVTPHPAGSDRENAEGRDDLPPSPGESKYRDTNPTRPDANDVD